jgi:hypothetical protein
MKLGRAILKSAVLVAALSGCAQKPALVAANCDEGKNCTKSAQPLTQIDKVDILLVVDNSGSISGKQKELKRELPRLLNAIVTGKGEDLTFPPASSVHVAVTTSDMGIGGAEDLGCWGLGDDGVFVKPDEASVSCDVMHPGYLTFEGGPASIATVDSVSCVPLGFLNDDNSRPGGCGFEQPLEAGLKALAPANDQLSFAAGHGHGSDENKGFLRSDSLLVVVVVSDEDDCSTDHNEIFAEPDERSDDPIANEPVNLRCILHEDKLYAVSRYVDGLKMLRPHNENVVFAAIAGVPTDLLHGSGTPDFAAILDDSRMQNVRRPHTGPDHVSGGADDLEPSCTSSAGEAKPPRRLVEVARGFAEDGVLGSLCADDFGATTGRIIRAIGSRLIEAANGSNAPSSDQDGG